MSVSPIIISPIATALDARKAIQRIVLVDDDGVVGNDTMDGIAILKAAAAASSWPPATAPQAPGFDGLTEALRAEYDDLYATMQYRWEDDHKDEPGLEAIYEGLRSEFRGVVSAIRANRTRYEKVTQLCGGTIPWWFVAIIHNMECGLSFKKHLHNGDPLTARTVLVPAGRPKAGSAPFTFEESAVDALTMPGKQYHLVEDWSVSATLYRLEGFNGYGYRKYHSSVLTPYLWSGSNHYTRGKYVADGQWSSTAVSKQLGTALVMRELLRFDPVQ